MASAANTDTLAAYAPHAPYILITTPSSPATKGVVLATINRPEKLNALSEPSWRALGACFAQLSRDPDVRAVVLAGAGDRAFCAGMDVAAAGQELAAATAGSDDVARKAKGLRGHILDFQDAVSAIARCEKPVIAVIHGIALGLAIDIATAADIRICAASARFAVKEVDIGLAADVGTLARLPRAVGNQSWVREVCMTARDFGAAEALSVGLVSRVCESKELALKAGLELAGTIAEKSPVAVQGTKEILNHSQDHSVDSNLRYAAMWNQAMLQSEDMEKALTSGLTKKKPEFAKL
jgi:delta(3,5)-delta(2,4)-dienoyl-CoA isomerase